MTETVAPSPRKALNPIVKFILELGPLALFFAAYSRLGIFAATGILMASVLVTLGVSYAMLRRFPIMPLVTAVIVLIFGSLTLVLGLILHDQRRLGEREQEGERQEAKGLELDPEIGGLGAPDDLVQDCED